MPAVETGVAGETVDLTSASDELGSAPPETSGPSNPRRRRRYLREPVPWRRSDVSRALVLVVVGVAVGVWGWFGVSGEVRLREQEGWLVVASFGVAIAACGGVYLVTVAMREVRLGQRQLMFDLADVMGWSVTVTKRGRLRLHGANEAADDRARESAEAGAVTTTLVVGPGMTIVHRSECPIARGKAVVEISAAEAAARGLGSCGVCASERSEGEVSTA